MSDPPPPPEATLRILIVDDDPLERELYRSYLSVGCDAGFRVSEADTGSAGLQMCDPAHLDCILVDYNLPDTNGLQLLDELNRKTDGDVPIILMTGVGSEKIAVDVLKAGASDYLPKIDISPDLLTRAIQGAVEKSRLRGTIDEQVRRIKAQNVELQRDREEIQRFYHNVSHELKTPLTSIREFASIILDGLAGPVDEEPRTYVGLIHESAIELTHEIDALLDLARLERDDVPMERCAVDVAEIIDGAVRRQSDAARAKGVIVRSETEDDLPRVHADLRQCIQVLDSLLSNAIAATDPSVDVQVIARTSRSRPGQITIAVVDFGCGIEEKEIERIFERLYQTESSGTHGEGASSTTGLGLGLAIARRLVEMQGGRLWVDSKVDVGSTFAFTLPRHEGEATPTDAPVV